MNASPLSFVSLFAGLVLSLASVSSVQAQDNSNTAEAPVSRAQVLAELQIWRLSGLAEMQAGESASDPVRPEYLNALARYQAMRSSPEFALRVARIERERAESRQIAKQ